MENGLLYIFKIGRKWCGFNNMEQEVLLFSAPSKKGLVAWAKLNKLSPVNAYMW